MRGGILISLVAAIALGGCGGSGSETPWPREPSGPALGPSGENAPPPSVVNEAEGGEEPATSEQPEQKESPGKKDAGP